MMSYLISLRFRTSLGQLLFIAKGGVGNLGRGGLHRFQGNGGKIVVASASLPTRGRERGIHKIVSELYGVKG